MEDDRSMDTGRRAPLAQVGLAALVAGTMLTFSALAFKTAFDEGGSSSVAARPSVTETAEPVVLPASEPRATDDNNDNKVAEAPAAQDQVLGKRISRRDQTASSGTASPINEPKRHRAAATDRHDHMHGKGHEKARGRGHHKDHHHKWDQQTAKEDDDDSWDRDSDDDHDDWKDDDSQSHSGHSNADKSGKGKSGKG